MTEARNAKRRFGNFRRALPYLRPHARLLGLGLLSAIAVGVFYTGSFTTIIPAIKVIISDHERLIDWFDRREVEHRLGIGLPADVPPSREGLLVTRVEDGSPNAEHLQPGARLILVDAPDLDTYELLERITITDADALQFRIAGPDDADAVRTLQLDEQRWWWQRLRGITAQLPSGRSADARQATLLVVLAVVVTVALLSGLFRFINEALIATAVQRTVNDMRCDLADHVLRMPMGWHSTHAVGDTLGRFSNDLSRVETGLWTLLGKTIREPFKAAGVLAVTIWIDWRIVVVAAIGLPAAAGILAVFGRLVRRAQRRASRAWGVLLDQLDELLAGIRVVKSSNMEAGEGRRFKEQSAHLVHAQTRIEVADAATKPALETIAVFAISGFIFYGASRVFVGALDAHMFFGAIFCLVGLFDPVRKLGNVHTRVQVAEAAAQRVFELMDAPTEQALEAADRPALPVLRERIEFRDISFAYPHSREGNVLHGISLEIERGRMLAIVGPNGSGKTTLVSLLLRFFEPTRGGIYVDGGNIAEYSLASLRAQIGLVTQDAVIFSGTVRENIVYGAGDATDEQVQRAARLAHLDEFLEALRREHDGRVTHGYDAEINARQLSGGQRQRIAIARAILRDPPILVLDEATSQVDSESERRIQEAFDDVARGRTTFVIAHRFSTIAKADRIAVLDRGRLVGFGSHADLLATCPVYAALCQTQFAAPTEIDPSLAATAARTGDRGAEA